MKSLRFTLLAVGLLLGSASVKAVPIAALDHFTQVGEIVNFDVGLYDDDINGTWLSGEVFWNGFFAGWGHKIGYEDGIVSNMVKRPHISYGLNEIWFEYEGYRTNSVFITLNRVPDTAGTMVLMCLGLLGIAAIRRSLA